MVSVTFDGAALTGAFALVGAVCDCAAPVLAVSAAVVSAAVDGAAVVASLPADEHAARERTICRAYKNTDQLFLFHVFLFHVFSFSLLINQRL